VKENKSYTQSEKELIAHNSMVGTLLDKAGMIRDPLKKPVAVKEEGCWKQWYTKLLVFVFSVVNYSSSGHIVHYHTLDLRI
jgi:hypothetical protein